MTLFPITRPQASLHITAQKVSVARLIVTGMKPACRQTCSYDSMMSCWMVEAKIRTGEDWEVRVWASGTLKIVYIILVFDVVMLKSCLKRQERRA